MARPIDPALRRARRLQIIDAGITGFARHGPATTIAQICEIAGIGSGTFFHHFANKQSLVIAILDLGLTETAEFFTAHEDVDTPRQLVIHFVDHMAGELSDPRTAGFVLSVGAMTTNEQITDALHHDEVTTLGRLERAVTLAQHRHQVRTDISAQRIAVWVVMLLDGLVSAIASGQVTAEDEVSMLHEQVQALLDGPSSRQASGGPRADLHP